MMGFALLGGIVIAILLVLGVQTAVNSYNLKKGKRK